MTSIDIKLLLFLGVGGLASFIFGLQGILNRRKINKISDFYMSANILLTGITAVVFLPFLLFFRFTSIGLSMMSEKRFDTLGIIWLGVIFFVYGIHGILYRKKINSPMFLQFCILGVVASIIIGVASVVALSRWGWPK